MNRTKASFLAVAVICTTFQFAGLNAQKQDLKENDTVYQTLERLQSDLDIHNRLKISGYVQAQYQWADTAGIESFAGGNFPSGVNNRFSVRRGRFKLAYNYAFSKYVIQVDVTEKGVGIKDAYLSLTDPWLNAFTLTTGVSDRPFGYEISYSSSVRETPERSRMFQTLFPGERELGAKLTIQAPKTSPLHFIRIDAGIFNGSGPTHIDFDSFKDFIGHLSISHTNIAETMKFGLGFSYYNGGWRQGTAYDYVMAPAMAGGLEGMAFMADSTGIAMQSKLRREYYGADAQFLLHSPLGITQIRAEYLTGTQPGVLNSTVSPSTQPTTDAYVRKFSGTYIYFIQDILQTKNQLVLKYDYYDPNTAVSGNEIGAPVNEGLMPTGAADIRYSTLGIGWAYRWNSQVKITAYYDFVRNETTSYLSDPSTLKDLSTDRRDNVFTLRFQYKF
jgi:hypothetical protein